MMARHLGFWILIFTSLASTLPCQAQRTVRWQVNIQDTLQARWLPFAHHLPKPAVHLPNQLRYTADSTQLMKALFNLRLSGYWLASFDTMMGTNADTLPQKQLYIGPHFAQLELQKPTVPAAAQMWIRRAFPRPTTEGAYIFSPKTFALAQSQLLDLAQNNGYPFAQVWLDSIQMVPSHRATGLSARLQLRTGPLVRFAPLSLQGSARVPLRYLSAYLGIRAGDLYRQQPILKIRERLRELPFVQAVADPTVAFMAQDATVRLYVEKRKTGQFDFLIGLLPRPNATNGQLLVTGALHAAFQNAFQRGEQITLSFDRLRPSTQNLQVRAALPYLLGWPLGVSGQLTVFRSDTTWLDVQSEASVQYLLVGGSQFQFFWQNRTLSLQNIDTVALLRENRLPAQLDMRQQAAGAAFMWQQLDYRFNPRRGALLALRSSVGSSQVRRNAQIEALSGFAARYDSLTTRATRIQVEAQVAGYVPFARRATLKLAATARGILSAKPLFFNEQWRVGGAKLLRGFDEESLFATRFVVATIEGRLLLSQNAYLAAFSDYGYVESHTHQAQTTLRPWSVGAGMTVETQSGLFALQLAVGRRDVGIGFDWRAPKFHVGYVSLF